MIVESYTESRKLQLVSGTIFTSYTKMSNPTRLLVLNTRIHLLVFKSQHRHHTKKNKMSFVKKKNYKIICEKKNYKKKFYKIICEKKKL